MAKQTNEEKKNRHTHTKMKREKMENIHDKNCLSI